MLGKLMKYEWKNIWKAGTLMLLGMLVVTVIGCVVLRMPGGVVTGLLDNNDINATQSWFVLSSFVATLILYVIMLLASTWGMLIFLGIRFYRSIHTEVKADAQQNHHSPGRRNKHDPIQDQCFHQG